MNTTPQQDRKGGTVIKLNQLLGTLDRARFRLVRVRLRSTP
ncbi:hypothetical protein [Nocardia acididurans]|nr:hypothetical protein [Nocardia acididurans]